MSKFNDLMDGYFEVYKDVIEEMPVEPMLDLTSLDKATGEQIKNGLAEIMGNDAEQMNQVLQGLIQSKSVNPNAQTAAPVQTQQAATAQVANQTSAPQNNPVAGVERRAAQQPTP